MNTLIAKYHIVRTTPQEIERPIFLIVSPLGYFLKVEYIKIPVRNTNINAGITTKIMMIVNKSLCDSGVLHIIISFLYMHSTLYIDRVK